MPMEEDLSFLQYDWDIEASIPAPKMQELDNITAHGQKYQRDHNIGRAFIHESARKFTYWADNRTRKQQLGYYKWLERVRLKQMGVGDAA